MRLWHRGYTSCGNWLGYSLASVNGCTPLGVITGQEAMRGIRIELFDGAGDRPNLTIANGTMIYADDRRDLCSCPAHEDFVSYVQLGAIDLPFTGDVA